MPSLVRAATRIFLPGAPAREMGRRYPLLFAAANQRNLRLISDGRRIIAHAGFVLRTLVWRGRRTRAALFGAVFTDPSLRGLGLGSRVMADAMARARSLGSELALVSGVGPLYARLGFSPWPRVLALSPPRSSAAGSARPGRFLATVATARELGDVRRLHAAAPVGLARTPQQWRALYRAGTLLYGRARLFVVRSATSRAPTPPVAYAIAEAAPRPGRNAARILEYAGDPSALADAFANACADTSLELVVPHWDRALLRATRARGYAERVVSLPWSVIAWKPDGGRRRLREPLPTYGLDYV